MTMSTDIMTNKLINLIVWISIFVGFAPTMLTLFANISGSGIVLAAVVATVLGILFGVYALKAGMAHLK